MTPSMLVIIITLLIFALIAALIFFMRGEKTDKRYERRAKLGFTSLENPPDEVTHRILALQPESQLGCRVLQVSQKSIGVGKIFLFDLLTQQYGDNKREEDGLVVVCPSIQLPRFRIFPLPDLKSPWGNLMNDMVGGATELAGGLRGMSRIRFTDAEFERRYTVLAEKESQTLAFFTPDRIRQIMSLDPFIGVSADGDTFQVNFMNVQRKSAEEILDLLMKHAPRLLQIFQG
jgi:hypothetical protein